MTWTPWKLHVEAMREAERIVGVLPGGTQWSFTITDDDYPDGQSALNIFLMYGESMRTIAAMLNLGNPTDEGEDFISYKKGPLLVSFIESEEQ